MHKGMMSLTMDPALVARSFGKVFNPGEGLPEVPRLPHNEHVSITEDAGQPTPQPAISFFTKLSDLMAKAQELGGERVIQLKAAMSEAAEAEMRWNSLIGDIEAAWRDIKEAELDTAVDVAKAARREYAEAKQENVIRAQHLSAAINAKNAALNRVRDAVEERNGTESNILSSRSDLRRAEAKVERLKSAAATVVKDETIAWGYYRASEDALAKAAQRFNDALTEVRRLRHEARNESYVDPNLGLEVG